MKALALILALLFTIGPCTVQARADRDDYYEHHGRWGHGCNYNPNYGWGGRGQYGRYGRYGRYIGYGGPGMYAGYGGYGGSGITGLIGNLLGGGYGNYGYGNYGYGYGGYPPGMMMRHYGWYRGNHNGWRHHHSHHHHRHRFGGYGW